MAGDFGEGLLTSLSFNVLIYKMAIITIIAFAPDAKPPEGCAKEIPLGAARSICSLDHPSIAMARPVAQG